MALDRRSTEHPKLPSVHRNDESLGIVADHTVDDERRQFPIGPPRAGEALCVGRKREVA